jgi:epoxide hydrolase 4
MIRTSGESRFAVNNGVQLHYHIRGDGPPVVLLHGFPEYWNVWRHQITDLSRDHCVIAPDLRGFNLSDKPKGIEQYSAATVAGDVFAILNELGLKKVALAGHDIGGMIAWWIASYAPERIDRLAILSAPHPFEYLTYGNGLAHSQQVQSHIAHATPVCLSRELPRQREASRYLDRMLDSGCARLDPERLTFWLVDDQERAELEIAIRRSDAEAVASYYKCNLSPVSPFLNVNMPRVCCPTLLMYSPDDPYILPEAYNRTGHWVDGPLTIKMVPGNGHFLHHSAVETVSTELRRWLGAAGNEERS